MTDDGEPRWLSPAQQEAWLGLASVMIWLPSALESQLQQDSGISHSDYQVLSWLSMAPDRTSRMSAVAEVANVTLSHLSRVVARLEGRGWVRREPDPQDGRITLAILTEAGWQKVVAAAPGHAEAVMRKVFDQLTPTQVGQLKEIAGRIAMALRPDCSGARLPRP